MEAKVVTPNEAVVGMSATILYGTDRYPTVVTDVYCFTTGGRAGQVKAVEVYGGKVFRLALSGRKAGLLVGSGGYGRLILGLAEYYRDPHL